MASKNYLTGHGLVVSTSNSRSSAYKLEDAGSLGTAISGSVSDGSVVLIDDVSVNDKDIALPVVATDDFRALYRFGRDFGTLTISGVVYLGPTDCKGGKGSGTDTLLKSIVSGYDEVRLSARKTPMKVSIAADQAYPCYPVQLTIEHPDAEYNSIRFQIGCILAPTSTGSK